MLSIKQEERIKRDIRVYRKREIKNTYILMSTIFGVVDVSLLYTYKSYLYK